MPIKTIEINITDKPEEVIELLNHLKAVVELVAKAVDELNAKIISSGGITHTFSYRVGNQRSSADEITELRNILKRASNPETQRP